MLVPSTGTPAVRGPVEETLLSAFGVFDPLTAFTSWKMLWVLLLTVPSSHLYCSYSTWTFVSPARHERSTIHQMISFCMDCSWSSHWALLSACPKVGWEAVEFNHRGFSPPPKWSLPCFPSFANDYFFFYQQLLHRKVISCIRIVVLIKFTDWQLSFQNALSRHYDLYW